MCESKILILPFNDPNRYDPGHLGQRRDGGNQVRSYKLKELEGPNGTRVGDAGFLRPILEVE